MNNDINQHLQLKPLTASGPSGVKIMTEMIMRCHGLGLEYMDGSKDVDGEALEIVDAIVQDVFVKQAASYPSLEDQAADLAIRIATDRPFPDGNRRTAVLTTLTMLDAYGRPVACSDQAVVSAALAAINGDMDTVRKDICSFTE